MQVVPLWLSIAAALSKIPRWDGVTLLQEAKCGAKEKACNRSGGVAQSVDRGLMRETEKVAMEELLMAGTRTHPPTHTQTRTQAEAVFHCRVGEAPGEGRKHLKEHKRFIAHSVQ